MNGERVFLRGSDDEGVGDIVVELCFKVETYRVLVRFCAHTFHLRTHVPFCAHTFHFFAPPKTTTGGDYYNGPGNCLQIF